MLTRITNVNGQQAFPKVLITNMSIIFTIYFMFGALGYYTFGSDVKEIVTLNLREGPLPDLVKAALSIGLFFTYPLMVRWKLFYGQS